ncbi:MAG: hypothetical protein PHV03_11010, partial [Desulfitobacteriaceae bacterium]|nr:hypothetical protein [Desulfitobacteriaceae bacterium]
DALPIYKVTSVPPIIFYPQKGPSKGQKQTAFRAFCNHINELLRSAPPAKRWRQKSCEKGDGVRKAGAC